MPDLVCSVENCTYNKEHLCALNEIKVGGEQATNSESTCCDSFRDQRDSFSNCENCGCGTKRTDVECEAENCVFNEECKCHADSIDVCGCGATKARATECSTFRCE